VKQRLREVVVGHHSDTIAMPSMKRREVEEVLREVVDDDDHGVIVLVIADSVNKIKKDGELCEESDCSDGDDGFAHGFSVVCFVVIVKDFSADKDWTQDSFWRSLPPSCWLPSPSA